VQHSHRVVAVFSVASVVAAVVAAGIPVVSLAASPNYVITAFSDAGDYIGQGVASEFDASNENVSGTLTSTYINLRVIGGTGNAWWNFEIAPPSGQAFHVGYYAYAQRTTFREAGHPGIDITAQSRGCNTDSGGFEIRRLATSNGAITRLDLLYEQHCEGDVPALFGEIRVNDPQTAGVLVSAAGVTWPYLPFGEQPTTAPIYVRNLSAAPATVGAVTLSGAEFSLVNDTCSGQVVAPGSSCTFAIAFAPRARGLRQGSAAVPINQSTYRIQLDALIRPGSTFLNMQSQSGDYIGQGLTYSFTPANAEIDFPGMQRDVQMNVNATDWQFWNAELIPASGQTLTPGTNYPNATRVYHDSGNGLQVIGDGRGCNTITGSFYVHQAVFSPVDNSPLNFRADFTQHCEGAIPALTGTIAWNTEPVTQAPPDVTNLTATWTGSYEAISWTNPTYQYYSYTVIRFQLASPLNPQPASGFHLYLGAGTSAKITGLTPGMTRSVAAFTVDRYGNVSPAEVLNFTA